MEFLLNFFIALCVFGIAIGTLVWALGQLTIIPEPMRQIGKVVLVVVGVFLLLGVVFGHVGGGLHFISLGGHI